MDKEHMEHIYSGMLLNHYKERNYAIYSNINGPRDYLINWSKSDREVHISYDITYVWNLKTDTNEFIYK